MAAKGISIIQMKGGVGKTAVSVNLAALLAKDYNKKILLVDVDPQTNATLSLINEDRWQEWEKSNGTLADVFNNKRSFSWHWRNDTNSKCS